jgi:hypothetical protein
MSLDNEEEVLESSTSEGDNNVETPTTTTDDADMGTSSAENPEAKEKPKPSAREELIRDLTGGKKTEGDEEDSEEPEAEEPESSDPEPVAKEGKIEDAEAEEASKHDQSDKRSKAQKRFEVLTTHNRDLKAKLDKQAPVATYGQNVLDFCRDAKITPERLGVWLSVAAAAEADPSKAGSYLDKLGIKSQPVIQHVKEVPQELEDKILDLAAEGSLTPEGVKLLLGITRTARATAPATAATPAAVETPRQTQIPASLPSPDKIANDKAIARAVLDIDNRDAEFAKKYPADWATLQPKIAEAMKRYQGTHPSKWIGFFEEEVAKAIAKVKRPVSVQTSLRPSTSNKTQTANKPVPGSRAALVAELVGKSR